MLFELTIEQLEDYQNGDYDKPINKAAVIKDLLTARWLLEKATLICFRDAEVWADEDGGFHFDPHPERDDPFENFATWGEALTRAQKWLKANEV